MPKLVNAVPKYRKHASGQAVVTIGGKDIYLGKTGSKASKQKYARVVADWLASDRSAARARAMGTWSSLRDRTWEGVVQLKSDAFAKSGLTFFVESCPHQPEAIAKQVPKPVICPPAGKIFNADNCPRR